MKREKDLVEFYAQKYPFTFVDSDGINHEGLLRRRERAWKLAKEAALLLKKRYGAKKVVVFGSLVHNLWFTMSSDVDLAAWGIPDDCFFAAAGEITEMNEEFNVDLVDGEKCPPFLRKAIKEGIEV